MVGWLHHATKPLCVVRDFASGAKSRPERILKISWALTKGNALDPTPFVVARWFSSLPEPVTDKLPSTTRLYSTRLSIDRAPCTSRGSATMFSRSKPKLVVYRYAICYYYCSQVLLCSKMFPRTNEALSMGKVRQQNACAKWGTSLRAKDLESGTTRRNHGDERNKVPQIYRVSVFCMNVVTNFKVPLTRQFQWSVQGVS